jgi:hypothetical protein
MWIAVNLPKLRWRGGNPDLRGGAGSSFAYRIRRETWSLPIAARSQVYSGLPRVSEWVSIVVPVAEDSNPSAHPTQRRGYSRSIAAFNPISTRRKTSAGSVPILLLSFARSNVVTW